MATPVFCCGFECGVQGNVGQHWGTDSGTGAFNTSTVRSGSRSYRLNPTSGFGGITSEATFVSSGGIYVWRFYVFFATLPSASTALSYPVDHARFPGPWFNASDNKIYAGANSAFGATGVSVTTGQWYRIDVRVNSSANPHLIDVQVDGVACGQKSDATAAATGDDRLSLANSASCTMDIFIDDVLMSVTSGDYPLGASDGVFAFVGTADGTHNVAGAADFKKGTGGVDITNATTDAYQLVDDVPLPSGTPSTTDLINAIAPPNASDYVEIVFGPAPGVSVPTTGPRAVEVIVVHHQAGTQSGNIRLALNDNGTLDDVLNLTAAGVTSFRYARKHYADPPSAASVWGVSAGNGNFNDVRMRFFSSDAAPDQYWDAAMIEAEFAQVSRARVPPRMHHQPVFSRRRRVV